MVYTFLVQFLILFGLLTSSGISKVDRIFSEASLGEKKLDSYYNRWEPHIFLDMYQGKMAFRDDVFFQNYFQSYLFSDEKEFSDFFNSELRGAMTCSNELFSNHFDDLRYSYRLIALSYLLEGQWHMNMVSKNFALKDGCSFDFQAWLNTCRSKSTEMNNFISLLKKYRPKYEESLPKSYSKSQWYSDFEKKDFKYYSHYRIDQECSGKCRPQDLETKLAKACNYDQNLMTLICSELDEIYGLSNNPDAYNLIGLSNIINTYNKQGEALGCLRRFSTLMSNKEVHYPVFKNLFSTLRAHLQNQYQERFLQGRVFFYGSSKEFEEKGLTNLYVMEQPLKIGELTQEAPLPKSEVVVQKIPSVPSVATAKKNNLPVTEKKKIDTEVKGPSKSAFLLASEMRKSQDLESVEVDMVKLKYDYVFTLNMINNLSDKLQNFMTREALKEMVAYDKLGSKEGPVPLLFLKFMIDMQEHTGLFNLISVLGDEFYVSNEIDEAFNPLPEKVKILNNDSTGRQWQFYIIRP